jgi:hypothetical protein
MVYRRMGMRDKALRDYDMAVRLKPTNPYPFYNRAVLHKEVGPERYGILPQSSAVVRSRPQSSAVVPSSPI